MNNTNNPNPNPINSEIPNNSASPNLTPSVEISPFTGKPKRKYVRTAPTKAQRLELEKKQASVQSQSKPSTKAKEKPQTVVPQKAYITQVTINLDKIKENLMFFQNEESAMKYLLSTIATLSQIELK